MTIQVGTEFENYEELNNAIRMYERENFVNLIVRDTRTIEAAAKRNHRKTYNPSIRYSDISFCCTYGGKKYVSHSTGKRNHKTSKQSCPFSLKVRATIDGQKLFVREFCDTHNHAVTEAEFRFHPKQRKLDLSSQEEIATLLALEPDKRLLRQRLMEVTGKVILMKDIHNIKTRLLSNKTVRNDKPDNDSDELKEDGTFDNICNYAERKAEKGSMLRAKKSISRNQEPKSVISLQKNSEETTTVLKDQVVDGRNALERVKELKEPEGQFHRKEAYMSMSELITVPLSHLGEGVNTMKQKLEYDGPQKQQQVIPQQAHYSGVQQQQQNPHHSTVLLHQQPQSSSPPLPSSTILHHSYLDTSTPSSGTYQQHQHPQPQFTPLTEPLPTVNAINTQQAPTEQLCSIGHLQQPNVLTYSPSAVTANVYPTTTSTNSIPLSSVVHRADSITTVILDTGCTLEDAGNLDPSSSYMCIENTAAEGQFTPWTALETINKPFDGQISDAVSAHNLGPSPLHSQSQTAAFPSILPLPNHHQHHCQPNGIISNSSQKANSSLLHEINNGAVSSSPILALSNTSDMHSTCCVHQQQQHQHQINYQQQIHEQKQRVHPQPCMPDTTTVIKKVGSSSFTQTVNHHAAPLSAKRKCAKWTFTKKNCSREGVRKMRKSSIQRDKDNLMKKYFQQATVNLFFNERLKCPGNKFSRDVNFFGVKMSGKQEDVKYNDALKPLSWLFGKWRSEKGMGKYPTIEDFTYIEEAEFFPIGMQPNVEYKFYSCHPNTKAPMHRETGFIKIKPGTNHIAFVGAHNFGVVDMQEGEVKDQELSVISTQSVGRTSFNKDPEVKKTTRTLKRTNDQLEHVLGMETVKTALTEHLRITFNKI